VDEIIADALNTLNIAEGGDHTERVEESPPLTPVSPIEESTSNSLSQPSEDISEETEPPPPPPKVEGNGNGDVGEGAAATVSPTKGKKKKKKGKGGGGQ